MSAPNYSLSGNSPLVDSRDLFSSTHAALDAISADALAGDVSRTEEVNLTYTSTIVSKLGNTRLSAEETRILFDALDASNEIMDIIGTNVFVNYYAGTNAERVIGNKLVVLLNKVQHAALRGGTRI